MSEADTVYRMTFAELAPLHATWVERNFPAGEPSDCLLGLGEELGELAETLPPNLSVISGRPLPRSPQRKADAIDAIGDVTIYLADFVRRVGPLLAKPPLAYQVSALAGVAFYGPVDSDRVHSPAEETVALLVEVGRLNHAYLKFKQGIRGTLDEREAKISLAVVKVLTALHRCAQAHNVHLDEVIAKTWAVVGARDWIANPTTGVASAS